MTNKTSTSHLTRAREVLDIEIEGLTKVRESLDASFDAAVDLILGQLSQHGKIVVTGIGKSLHIGQKMAATLTSTGTPAVTLHPSEALHGDLGILQPNDVIIALSYSGETEELINVIPIFKRCGVQIIAMTGVPDSTLGSCCDAVISVQIDREACPFNMAPTTSTTATLAVGDALAITILEARGFKRDDFAKLHPGGSIGKTLLLKASDIMRDQDRTAVVEVGATVREAVLAMTSARSGAAAVIDKDRIVVGLITDGDLRRHITDAKSVIDQPVGLIMTADPITLPQDALAVDVINLYQQRNIDDLVLVDEKGCLIGMIDIQDLPKLKIL